MKVELTENDIKIIRKALTAVISFNRLAMNELILPLNQRHRMREDMSQLIAEYEALLNKLKEITL